MAKVGGKIQSSASQRDVFPFFLSCMINYKMWRGRLATYIFWTKRLRCGKKSIQHSIAMCAVIWEQYEPEGSSHAPPSWNNVSRANLNQLNEKPTLNTMTMLRPSLMVSRSLRVLHTHNIFRSPGTGLLIQGSVWLGLTAVTLRDCCSFANNWV